LDRQIAAIERETRSVMDMDEGVFTRWSFLVGEFRRYADSTAKLAAKVFASARRQPWIFSA
jgi:hypothetical protein